VPFDFLKRKKTTPEGDRATPAAPGTAETPAPEDRPTGRGIAFDGLTEEWRIVGTMDVTGRLSDVLNRRESVTISDVRWAPIDGSGELVEAPGLKAVDPYDLIVVLAGEATLPPFTEEERAAHRIHKVPYDVAMEVPPFRVVGTVYLYPGSEPERLLDRATEMFVPVVDATAYLGDRPYGTEMDAVLVNRMYLRGIEQVDRRTGEPPQRLPGTPMGGTSWQERTR
jgi:hypothetical protein